MKLISEIEVPPQRFVAGDSHRLVQIIINFISNAAKFTREGQIEFRVAEKKGAPNGKKTEFCFTVSDTGIGMDEQTTLKLFKPFVQVLTLTSFPPPLFFLS